jgi:hypothetical protein
MSEGDPSTLGRFFQEGHGHAFGNGVTESACRSLELAPWVNPLGMWVDD